MVATPSIKATDKAYDKSLVLPVGSRTPSSIEQHTVASMTDKQELTALLRKHLNKSSFTPADCIPAHGGLPLSIPAIRIDPWFYPMVNLEASWALAVETALLLKRTPVLAHKRIDGWCFRVPLYMLNPDFELTLDVEKHHDFEHTVEMSVKAFSLVLRDYQDNVATRTGWIQKINTVLREVEP